MYELEQIKSDLKQRISEHRYLHTQSVVDTAVKFAKSLKEDALIPKLEIAAWLHDSCKELANEEMFTLAEFFGIEIHDEDKGCPNLLHARVAAAWVEEEYQIYDPDILRAISDHTFAGVEMPVAAKILFLADMLEPNRDKNKPSAELNQLREMIENSEELDLILFKALESKIQYVINKGQPLHPLSIKARNAMIK